LKTFSLFQNFKTPSSIEITLSLDDTGLNIQPPVFSIIARS
jgi:hypothetical protein